MTPDHQRKRDDQRPMPSLHLQFIRHEVHGKYDHHSNASETDNEGQLEPLPYPGNFDPERGTFDFFSCRAPCPVEKKIRLRNRGQLENAHVITKQVGQHCRGEMDTQPSEKEQEEGNPSNVLEEGSKEPSLP